MNEIDKAKKEIKELSVKIDSAMDDLEFKIAIEMSDEKERLTEILEKLEKRNDIIDSILNG